jgi:hypothetical protein
LISDCTFKGKEVQVVYDLVYKLQQLYLKWVSKLSILVVMVGFY